ncbi:MAG: TetR/AcrR family transcriptional regulator [Pseudomonadota bacterium]
MGLKRSVTDAEKLEKKSKIVAAARAAFEYLSFHDISMSFLAERTGLAKGTIYLYFDTKESVFLSVLAHEIRNWFLSMHQSPDLDFIFLSGPNSPMIPEKIAAIFASATKKNPKMVELLAFLKPVLEEKIPSREWVEFKDQVKAQMVEFSKILVSKGWFSHEKFAMRFVFQAYTGLIGMYQMSAISKYEGDSSKSDTQRNEFYLMLNTLLQTLFLGAQASRTPSLSTQTPAL